MRWFDLKPLVALLTSALMLLVTTATYAQEAVEEVQPAEAAAGISTGVLFVGVLAVLLVAAIWMARERAAEKHEES